MRCKSRQARLPPFVPELRRPRLRQPRAAESPSQAIGPSPQTCAPAPRARWRRATIVHDPLALDPLAPDVKSSQLGMICVAFVMPATGGVRYIEMASTRAPLIAAGRRRSWRRQSADRTGAVARSFASCCRCRDHTATRPRFLPTAGLPEFRYRRWQRSRRASARLTDIDLSILEIRCSALAERKRARSTST